MKNKSKYEVVEKEPPKIDEEFLDVADAILITIETYSKFNVKSVKETPYKGLKMQELVQMFEDENFYKFSKTKVCELCTEVVTRLSRQLSSVPSVVRPSKELEAQYLMYTESKENKILINFDEFTRRYNEEPHPFFKQENVGIHYLHSIMHELYHTLQNYNFYKFLEGMPYEKDTICSTFQDILSGTYLQEYENEEDTRTLYDADLDELNANIFAAKMLDKFIEKDYFKNSKEVEKISKFINALVCDSYSKEAINFAKNSYLRNRKVLSRVQELEDKDLRIEDPGVDVVVFADEEQPTSQVSNDNGVLLTEEEVMVLKSVSQFISGLDMRSYQSKMLDEVIRYEQEFNAFALGKTEEELGFFDDKEPEIEEDIEEYEQGDEPEK